MPLKDIIFTSAQMIINSWSQRMYG